MKILLDTNILLDVFLERPNFVRNSAEVWAACDSGRCKGFIAATSVPVIHFIAQREVGLAKANEAIDKLLSAFALLPVDEAIIRTARTRDGSDFEDDIHIAVAMTASIDFIVTRDKTGFQKSPIPAVSPGALLKHLAQMNEQEGTA